MRWALLIVGVVAALIVLVVIIGALLPVAHVASRSAVVRAAPEVVWRSITDVAAFPTWRSGISSVQVLPEQNGHRRWEERGKDGTIIFEATTFEPPRQLVARIASTGLPFGGSWTYLLEPAEGGTRVTITENGEVYNPLYRFLSRFVFGHASTMEAYLRDLGRKHA